MCATKEIGLVTMEKNLNGIPSTELKGVRLKTTNIVLTTIEIILFLWAIGLLIYVYRCNVNIIHISDEYIAIEQDVLDFKNASDYLTDQARQFLISCRPEKIHNYYNELYETQRREKALAHWKDMMGTNNDEYRVMMQAYQMSQQLEEVEVHSMKLICVQENISIDQFPETFQKYEISTEELSLDEATLRNRAYYLLYDANYTTVKNLIGTRIEQATKAFTRLTQEKQSEAAAKLNRGLIALLIATLSFMSCVVFNLIVYIRLVIRPLNSITKKVESDKPLDIKGSYELKVLERTYNKVLEFNHKNRDELKHQTEHDSLTGLLNRKAYDDIRESLTDCGNPLALMIVDVDDFKNVNDVYGHEIGDLALQHVANVLNTTFRTEDYVFRIGGDEFAAILNNIAFENKEALERKLNRILESISNPPEGSGVPKISVSIGVAFSKCNYGTAVTEMADYALYETKENGKNGYTIFEEEVVV